jgi:putative ABC transport system permease protein
VTRLSLWFRFALRELRSGLGGFWIFLICLALGSASIAIVGSLSASIGRGLSEQGQSILGGDIEFAILQRDASAQELAFFGSKGEVSRTVTLRAMATRGSQSALVEMKAVDAAYPMFGALKLEGAGLIAADPLAFGRLGAKPGDGVKLGDIEIRPTATIIDEPDRLSDGFLLGPRLLIDDRTLAATGLIQPGSLVTYHYRVKLTPGLAPAAVSEQAKAQFPNAGWQIKTRDRAAQGTDRFVQRLAAFMNLVGLTALIVGGAGIANAISAFVDRRLPTIATLKCLGAKAEDIFAIYMAEILLVAMIGIGFGLALGAATPVLAVTLLQGMLPLPLSARVEWAPLLLTTILSLLVTLSFSIWPLARTHHVSAAALFRHHLIELSRRPPWPYVAAIGASLAALAGVIFLSFDDRRITSYYLGGLVLSFIVLFVLAQAITRIAAVAPKPSSALWRHAIANLHRPGSAAASVILALGLGLTLFVALALVDRSITGELRASIPERAPAFFFLDVRNGDLVKFTGTLQGRDGITAIDNAPMLRGRIVKVNDTPAEKIVSAGESSWALRGDRGLTYAETLPEGSSLVQGAWWPKNYEGPPLVSFVEDVGKDLGLKLGDTVTVNVLGRDVAARIANFRAVNWRSFGINFVLVFSPNTLKSAPHSHIVTVEMTGGDEARLLNDTAKSFPSVSAIRVKDALAMVSDILGKMLAAIRGANSITLLTGLLVLAGALSAGLARRTYESVILKTYGASRAQLVKSLVIEYAVLGLSAAIFAILVGSLGAWFVTTWILEMQFRFSPATAAVTALASMAITVAAGLIVTWRALSAKAAPLLRNE